MSSLGAVGAQAQGTVRGAVHGQQTQEPVIGASVSVEGNTIGTATDPAGAFLIAGVLAGPHALRLSSVGCTGKTVPGPAVATGKVVVNTFLSSSNAALAEVVVTAQRHTNTEITVM